jgi:hypothetical protein
LGVVVGVVVHADDLERLGIKERKSFRLSAFRTINFAESSRLTKIEMSKAGEVELARKTAITVSQ